MTATTRVGLIGYGAIGRHVADELRRGAVPGAALTAVLTRGARLGAVAESVPTVDALTDIADLVVEVAGHEAVRDCGPAVLASGTDLLIVSTGALADPSTTTALALPTAAPPHATVVPPHPATAPPHPSALPQPIARPHPSAPVVEPTRGRLMFCPGAIGGFDLLAALRRAGSTVTVRLTSVKGPAALVRPWMSDALLATLAGLGANDAPVAVHDGSAATAATLFPQNANIAASLALAVGDWEAVTVRIVADAGTPTTIHVVEIASDAGSYRLEFRNHPSPDNPRSSALVAASVLRCIETIAAGGDGHFT